ncbi:ExeM/NucH family extracellular endonuclease [Gryllotalpicola ginsengisoli]|uniref:ExeM/NucH family extracellular endonuclease n=1 Tax=Gryllotalpicola ginsengisoli TaxID=444608 RepID=UPI0003B5C60F|nr:ExeM/NucH family extracellular endonuclease [Gryllotalpicola ginsengisoli]
MPSARARRALVGALSLSTAALVCQLAAAPAFADPAGDDVVIDEVYGGGGNSGATYTNDFIELYNPTDQALSLAGWSVQYRSASGTSAQVTALSGSIPAHGHYLVEEAAGSGGTTALPTPDATGGIAMSASSGVVILSSGTSSISTQGDLAGASGVVDAVGYGSATSYETEAAPALSNTTSDSRASGADSDDNAADFTAGAPDPQNTGSAGGGDAGGGDSGDEVSIAQIQGTDTDTSPYAGETVTTEGVVTAVYATGGFNGFYLETGGAGGTAADDTTPGASDAVFVYGSQSAAQVEAGESVRVTGEVSEYQGETEISKPTVTELAAALPAVVPDTLPWSDLDTDAEKEAHEGELVSPQGDFTVSDNYDANWYGSFTLAAGDTPLRQPTDAADAGSAEAQAVAADNAARTITLDDGSSANYSSSANENTPLPWLTASNAVSIGARVTFHEPVILDYRFSLWNFQPTHQVTDDGSDVATFSDRRAANEQPEDVGGSIRLATFNVENYFPMTGEEYEEEGLGTCSYYTDRAGNPIAVNTCTGTDGSAGPRGAADDASFARQQEKIVTGITRLDASIVSLEEVENSAKFGEDRDAALAGLVDALNRAAGSQVWAYVPSPDASQLPPLSGQDVIRTAFIYKPADVSPVGASKVLADQSGAGQPFSIAREPLAQGFKKAGALDSDAFLVVANHLKSKGADSDPLYDGDTEDTSSPASDQGAFNETRVHEVKAVNDFATATAKELGTDRIFLVGDFNAYTQEDPMQTLYADGYTDLGSTYDPSEQTYSYDGLEGSLDHVLANAAALKLVTGADVWQINAQEAIAYAYSRYNYNATLLFDGSDPFAASDHDPVVVGLNAPVAATWDAKTVYTEGDYVYYDGSTWLASWYTKNQKPGDVNGPWQQIETTVDGTAVWTPSRIFEEGDVVSYDGELYTAKWWTRNQVPGAKNGPWQLNG